MLFWYPQAALGDPSMLFRRILQLLQRRPHDVGRRDDRVADPGVHRAFSSTQNCDVKVSAARSADIDMVPPNHR